MGGPNEGVGTNWYNDATYQSYISTVTSTQSSYDAQVTALNNAKTDYEAKKAALNEQIAIVSGMTSSDPGYAAAVAELDSRQDAFDASKTTYNNLLTTYTNTLSKDLIDAKKDVRNYIDTKGDDIIDAFILELLPIINKELTLDGEIVNDLDVQLTNADDAREAARTAFLNALTAYYDNEFLLSQARNTLKQLQDEALVLQAEVLITDNDPGAVAAYNAKQAEVAAQQTVVDSYVSQAATLKSNLDTAFDNLHTAMDNLKSVLQTAYNTASSVATTYISDSAAAMSAIDTQMQTALQAKIDADQTALQDYLAANPTDPSVLNPQITTIDAAVAFRQNLTRHAGILEIGTVGIDLPRLPPAGQSMSIADLMRFITQIQLYFTELSRHLQQSTNLFNQFRTRLWGYEIDAEVNKADLIVSYFNELMQKDIDYNNAIADSNRLTESEFSSTTQSFNINLTDINALIDQINQEITDQNDRGKEITEDLNSTAYITRDLINESGKIGPDITNLWDVQMLDTDTPYPTQLGDPTVVSYPTEIPTISHLTSLSTVPGLTEPPISAPGEEPTPPLFPTTPTQMEIDAYNAQIAVINERLAPYASRFGSLVTVPIDKLYYKQYTDVRLPVDVGLTVTTTFVAYLGDILVRIAQLRPEGKDDPVAGLRQLLLFFAEPTSPAIVRSTETTGASAAILSAELNVDVDALMAALNETFDSQLAKDTIKSLIEQAIITGALQASIRLPSENANYLIKGTVDEERISELRQVLDKRLTEILGETIATSFLDIAQNEELLLGTAQAILPTIDAARGLSPQELEELIGLLVFLQQLIFLLLAALVTSGGTDGKEALTSLLGPNAATITPQEFETLLENLKKEGIPIPPSVTQTSPLDLINSIENELLESEKADLKKNINDVFKRAGLDVLTSQESIVDGINRILDKAAEQTAERVREEIRSLIIRQANDLHERNRESAGVLGGIPPLSASFPDELKQKILGLAGNVPILQGLPEDQRVSFLAGLATGRISSDNGRTILQHLLYVDNKNSQPAAAQFYFDESTEPVRPKTVRVQFREAFDRFSKHLGDENKAREFLDEFQAFTRTQREFGKLAVELILDPAKLMVRSFTIYTQDPTSRGNQPPTSIPIAG